MSEYETYEKRARELMLFPDERKAFLKLMTKGDRGEYHIYCPACKSRIETYELTILKHVRTCKELREEK
jgi:hypothetical protein